MKKTAEMKDATEASGRIEIKGEKKIVDGFAVKRAPPRIKNPRYPPDRI